MEKLIYKFELDSRPGDAVLIALAKAQFAPNSNGVIWVQTIPRREL